MIKESASDRRPPINGRQAMLSSLEHRVGDLAVDVELELRCGGIANADWTRAFKPREPRHLPFRADAARHQGRT